MSFFKRISATVFARVDESIRQIENHDAVISAAICETRHKAAQAKVRLNRVRADGERLHTRLSDLRASEEKWTQRAREQGDKDEETALVCLRRRRDCQQQIKVLEASVEKHQHVESHLIADMEKLEQRVAKITQQRNLMRSRHSAAEVNRCLQEIEGLGQIDIDDTFERWEMQITEQEFSAGDISLGDDLERRFLDEEERAELKVELKAIKQDKEN